MPETLGSQREHITRPMHSRFVAIFSTLGNYLVDVLLY